MRMQFARLSLRRGRSPQPDVGKAGRVPAGVGSVPGSIRANSIRANSAQAKSAAEARGALTAQRDDLTVGQRRGRYGPIVPDGGGGVARSPGWIC